jgi:hypothetical protein
MRIVPVLKVGMSPSLKMYPFQLYHTQVGRHNRRNLSKKLALLHLLDRQCQILNQLL